MRKLTLKTKKEHRTKKHKGKETRPHTTKEIEQVSPLTALTHSFDRLGALTNDVTRRVDSVGGGDGHGLWWR